MKRKLPIALGVLFVFVFAFSIAFAVTAEASDGSLPPACCYRPPSGDCGASWGEWVWHNGHMRCSCSTFNHPECRHICGVCW